MIAIRWLGRVLGLFVVGLVLTFTIGRGFNFLNLQGAEIALAFAFLVALTGMLVLWGRELLGGMMVIGGMGAFYAINFLASGRWPGGWVFPVCVLPGILAVVCWWSTRTPVRLHDAD